MLDSQQRRRDSDDRSEQFTEGYPMGCRRPLAHGVDSGSGLALEGSRDPIRKEEGILKRSALSQSVPLKLIKCRSKSIIDLHLILRRKEACVVKEEAERLKVTQEEIRTREDQLNNKFSFLINKNLSYASSQDEPFSGKNSQILKDERTTRLASPRPFISPAEMN